MKTSNTSSRSPRRYLIATLIVFITSMLAMGLLHYKTDLWGIFGEDYQHFYKGTQPNPYYLKTRYLIEHKDRYDCILFGSSRVRAIDASLLGNRCYNFNLGGSGPAHYLHALELLIENDVKLEKIYFGLDDFSYKVNVDTFMNEYFRRLHPKSLWDWLKFYTFYLVKPPHANDWNILKGHSKLADVPEYIVDPNIITERFRPAGEKMLTLEGKLDSLIQTMEPKPIPVEAHLLPQSLETLARFKHLCDQENISLVWFFNPLHYKTFLSNDLEQMARFKRGVTQLQPFHDFSGLNAYAVDNRYWHDISHYSTLVGDKIRSVLSHSLDPYDGFGRLVTSANIDSHLQQMYETAPTRLPDILAKEGKLNLPKQIAEHITSTNTLLLWDSSQISQDMIRSPARQVTRFNADGNILLHSIFKPPTIEIHKLPLRPNASHMINIVVEVPAHSQLKLYYAANEQAFVETQSVFALAGRGPTNIKMLVHNTSIDKIRIEPGKLLGTYKISSITITALDWPEKALLDNL